jgi:hypothetical protein
MVNISDSVPEFGANMAQVTIGKFFSGVPQKRKSGGDSKKILKVIVIIIPPLCSKIDLRTL